MWCTMDSVCLSLGEAVFVLSCYIVLCLNTFTLHPTRADYRACRLPALHMTCMEMAVTSGSHAVTGQDMIVNHVRHYPSSQQTGLRNQNQRGRESCRIASSSHIADNSSSDPEGVQNGSMVPGHDAFVEGSVVQRGQNPMYGPMLYD